jgi:hypothetical protein
MPYAKVQHGSSGRGPYTHDGARTQKQGRSSSTGRGGRHDNTLRSITAAQRSTDGLVDNAHVARSGEERGRHGHASVPIHTGNGCAYTETGAFVSCAAGEHHHDNGPERLPLYKRDAGRRR